MPQPYEQVNGDGKKVTHVPGLFPYMWKDVDYNDLDKPVSDS